MQAARALPLKVSMLTEDQIKKKLECDGRIVKSICTEEKPDGTIIGYTVTIDTPIGTRTLALNQQGEPCGSQG